LYITIPPKNLHTLFPNFNNLELALSENNENKFRNFDQNNTESAPEKCGEEEER
jgi:hypothetical protein